MLRRVEVLRSVLVLGRIAAANMSATQAQAQMDPPVTHLQAFFTTLGMRFDVFDLIEMSAFGH
jgi:hypothetical protein